MAVWISDGSYTCEQTGFWAPRNVSPIHKSFSKPMSWLKGTHIGSEWGLWSGWVRSYSASPPPAPGSGQANFTLLQSVSIPQQKPLCLLMFSVGTKHTPFSFWWVRKAKASWAVCGRAELQPGRSPLKAVSQFFVSVWTSHLCSPNDDLSGFQKRTLKGLIEHVAAGAVSIYKYFNRILIPSQHISHKPLFQDQMPHFLLMKQWIIFFLLHLKREKIKKRGNCHTVNTPKSIW